MATAPNPVKTPPPKKELHLPSLQIGSVLNLVILLLIIGGIGSVLFIGWQALLNPPTPLEVAEMEKPADLPLLKLNHTHQRAGDFITVNPDSLGKTNPFQPAGR